MQAPPRLPLPAWLAPAVALAFCVGPAAAQIDLAPPNDLFAHRTDLGSPETIEVRQKVLRASTEFGDPVEDSVWWQWTAPHDGWWEIESSPSQEKFYDAVPMQVFQGVSLQTLVVVPNGGYRVPDPGTRRLFRAAAGKIYQFGGSCISPPNLTLNAPDVDFTLRPTAPAANSSREASVPLLPVSSKVWGASGWSTEVGLPPLSLADGTEVHAPLYWTWTCPETGHYAFWTDDSNNSKWPAIAGFKGTGISPSAQLPGADMNAQAGEIYTIVTGSLYYASYALTHQSLKVGLLGKEAFIPPNTDPYPIAGLLPVTLTPPTGAPHSYQLHWQWNSQITGWVEFDGGTLAPELRSATGGAYPAVLTKAGKHFFWIVPGVYRLSVTGWDWSQGGGAFTLRCTSPEVPANDALTKAGKLELNVALTGDSFFGGTRELGDPAATMEFPRPTLWYRWQPGLDTGMAEMFLSRVFSNESPEPELRVYAGTDPAFFTEIEVTRNTSGEFVPAHWSFPVGSPRSAEYFLCLTGATDQFDLNLRLVKPGEYNTQNGNKAVTTLVGREVAEASALVQYGTGQDRSSWFKWSAPADGWLSASTTVSILEMSVGSIITNLQSLDSSKPAAVSAGSTYWFRTSTGLSEPAPPVHRLRLQFAEASGTEPGDDPASPIPLGSPLPAQTVCRLMAGTVTTQERAWCRGSLRANLLHGIWYSWTAPPDVDGCSVSTPNAWCDVFADAPGGPLTAFSLNDYPGQPFFFKADPGRHYFLFVQSTTDNGTNAVIPLSLQPWRIEVAANSTIAGASVLPASLSFQTSGLSPAGDDIRKFRLTEKPDEPLADPAVPDATHTAWWRWTALSSGPCSVQCLDASPQNLEKIENSGSRKFTIAVYEDGTSPADLVRVPGTLSAQRPGRGNYSSDPPGKRFAFRAEAGKTYLVQAASPDEFGGISVSVNPGDAYDTWILSQTGIDSAQSAPEDNPAGDGLNNLLKFCLGLDPSVPASGDPNISRAPSAILADDGSGLSYQFWSDRFNTGFQIPAPANASPGIANTARVVAERSLDLSYWSKATDAESLGDNRWRVTLPINGTQPRRFIRLRAEWVRPPPPQ